MHHVDMANFQSMTHIILVFEQISQLMYDVHNNRVPENILKMLQKVSCTHECRTRSTTNESSDVQNTITEKKMRLDLFQDLVFKFGIVSH